MDRVEGVGNSRGNEGFFEKTKGHDFLEGGEVKVRFFLPFYGLS